MALNGRQRGSPPVPRLLDGEQEAQLVALRLGPPPPGYANGSLRLLARQVVELGIVESICHETARRTQKNGFSSLKLQYRVIPLQADAAFAAHMEEVLETCDRPYDAQQPVVCMDEQPVQLVMDARASQPSTENHPQRVDCEYERAGTAAVFMFCEPLSGWRQATARERRTKTDWARAVADLLEGRCADRGKVSLVLDNLNTHTKGAFHTAFEPERARDLVRRIEICYTPKHGSWPNIAECELSAMTRKCRSGRRIGELSELGTQIAAWSADVNARQRGVESRMRIDAARSKLKADFTRIIL